MNSLIIRKIQDYKNSYRRYYKKYYKKAILRYEKGSYAV